MNELQTATKQVLDALGEIKTEVALVGQKVDGHADTLTDHETRVRSMERKYQYAAGAVGLVTVLIGVAAWAL